MKLEYYNFDDLLSFDCYQNKTPVFQKNYKTKELAISAVVNNFKPNFTLYCIDFCDLRLYKEVEKEYPVYHSKKKDKDGLPKIIETEKRKVNEISKDYSDYAISENGFGQRTNANYLNKKGFYKIKLSDPIHEIVDGNLVYKSQIFVKFFDAKINITPEVKESGKPYQPYSCNVEESEISDWLPVYYTKGNNYSSSRFYLSSKSGDWWLKTHEYWVEKTIYITKHELEIEE